MLYKVRSQSTFCIYLQAGSVKEKTFSVTSNANKKYDLIIIERNWWASCDVLSFIASWRSSNVWSLGTYIS